MFIIQNKTKLYTQIGLVTFLLILGIVVTLPFIWMITTSFKPENETMSLIPTLFPKEPTLKNYRVLFEQMKFLTYLKATLAVVVFYFVGLFINALAGYGFAKFEFKGKNIIFILVLATMMIPSQVTMIPVYLMLNSVKLTGTILGIALPGIISAFSIFLFRQFMSTVPTELIEAARIDGSTEFGIFFKIVLPIAKPILAVQGILTFIAGWNSFLWPLIIGNNDKFYTLSVGLQLLKGQNHGIFGLQMAAATFMVVPIIIIFIVFQKHIIESQAISGIK